MPSINRLAESFSPENYDLAISIDRQNRKFSGTVNITGELLKNSDSITLHAKDLKIAQAEIDGKIAKVKAAKNDELVLTLAGLKAGKHNVKIDFNGQITEIMNGMYICHYTHNGTEKELVATQLESHYARQVFPCVDEPAAKAIFSLTLETESDITVLSNTPVKSQKSKAQRLITQFETTPKMSSYLLAWVAGELQSKSTKTKSGVDVNVWATLAQPADSLDFGLDIAKRAIEFFEDYFDTPYPLAKSDHVALPDFSSAAMENWGLITYRETALLSDPKNASISSKHYIATVISHELAHQWFGNLVTMKWWNDLWLNESFATLMSYAAVDHMHPEWKIWLDFASQEGVLALNRDSIDGVQAVQAEVNHPDEIATLFDGAIVYAKGARLLKMLRAYVGEQAFQTGLKQYFKIHSYKNTQAADLWKCFAKSSNKDVEGFMAAWLEQSGFPVIEISQQNKKLKLTQKQFFVGPHRKSEKIWPIPLNADNDQIPKILNDRSSSTDYYSDKNFRLNVDDNAHFVTHYPDDILGKILTRLDKLSAVDRLRLLHEQVLLARGGVISSSKLIPLLQSYGQESEDAVWDLILIAINDLKKFVETDKESESKLKQFATSLATDQYERLGWNKLEGELETDTKLRSTIIGCMLYGENPTIIDAAQTIFASTSVENLDAELRPSIIGVAVRHSNDPQKIVNNLIKLYRRTSSSELQDDITSGITSVKQPDLVDFLLATAKDKSIVRPQDFLRWLFNIMRNRHGRDIAWQWVQDNWSWIDGTFRGDPYYDIFPRYIANCLTTQQQLNEYKLFFEPLKKVVELKRNIEIGIGEIKGRVELIDRDSLAVKKALYDL